MPIVENIYNYLITDAAANLGVAGGIIVAFIAYARQVSTDRKRATFDFLETRRLDTDHIKYIGEFTSLDEKQIKEFSSQENKISEQHRAMGWVCNYYEAMALQIHQGLFDEETLFRTCRSSAVKAWRKAAPFIDVIQSGSNGDPRKPEFFCEFHNMAQRWSNIESYAKLGKVARVTLPLRLWCMRTFPPSSDGGK